MIDHQPVLLKEVKEILLPGKGKRIIDATLGLGGHTRVFLESGAEVLALERDPEMVPKAKKRLSRFLAGSACPGASLTVVRANFSQIEKVAKERGFFPVDGVFFDLGLSRWHLKEAGRGFSFDDPSLDGRLSPEEKLTMAAVVNHFSEEELEKIFSQLAQEPFAKEIARAIVQRRQKKKWETAAELSRLIEEVYQKKRRRGKRHPATKVFLALRILVNRERENLKKGLEGGWRLLKSGGRLVVISFHSGEDRIVKQFLRQQAKKGEGKVLTKKAIRPTREERERNPSSRSALLRGGEKR